MKKFVTVFAASLMIFASAGVAEAASGKIIDGRTLVPVRGVFEELGFNVDWDAETATATISDADHNISITKGVTYFYADGETVVPDVPQQIIDGSFYLPLRAVGDSVGADVSWDGETKTAHISYKGSDSYVNCGVEPAPAASTTTAVNTSSVYGNYKSYVDLTDMLVKSGEVPASVQGGFGAYFDLALSSDGKASLKLDAESTKASMKTFFSNNLAAIMSASGKTVTDADVDEMCKAMGTSREQLIESFMTAADVDNSFDLSTDTASFTVNGNTSVLDGAQGTIENGVITFVGIPELEEAGIHTITFEKK